MEIGQETNFIKIYRCNSFLNNIITIFNKMKKEIVKNQLAFKKAAVMELNENSLHQINGGSSSGCICDAVKDVINDVMTQITKPIVNAL